MIVSSNFLLQFFVHDTDFSSPLPRFEFQGNLNEVWMQITVPKVIEIILSLFISITQHLIKDLSKSLYIFIAAKQPSIPVQ